ncbi:MAG: toll/interleukin-1 receptor domain-containing protein [Anaerolineae bacterium]|nr:toll/interleukin-1 receptor domain-containing protein [Anaerolineae bacterium]NUQ06466.1 toll/interleukin-1 receptor domain-containing protein [Anaerolineae bacterium]
MQHVFISYSSKDIWAMRLVATVLRTARFDVWVDERLEHTDAGWRKQIETAIRESACVIVLVSPNSYESRYVEEEIAVAESAKRTIIPVVVHDDGTERVPFGLQRLQRFDLRQKYTLGLKDLAEAVGKYAQPLSEPTTEEPHSKFRALTEEARRIEQAIKVLQDDIPNLVADLIEPFAPMAFLPSVSRSLISWVQANRLPFQLGNVQENATWLESAKNTLPGALRSFAEKHFFNDKFSAETIYDSDGKPLGRALTLPRIYRLFFDMQDILEVPGHPEYEERMIYAGKRVRAFLFVEIAEQEYEEMRGLWDCLDDLNEALMRDPHALRADASQDEVIADQERWMSGMQASLSHAQQFATRIEQLKKKALP